MEFNNILFISCHIQPSEGGGFLFAPGQTAATERLNICVMSHGYQDKADTCPAVSPHRKAPGPEGVRTYECREVSIHTEAALPGPCRRRKLRLSDRHPSQLHCQEGKDDDMTQAMSAAQSRCAWRSSADAVKKETQ
ncbi:MAG: hypothetical protein ACLTW9_29715 [Enterocloster sp.]